jgi:hypothetical protein
MSYDPIVKDGDTYLYFYVDTSEDINWDAEGRFNGARLDLNGILWNSPGQNAFDVCFLALFRSVEEAEEFVMNWIGVEEEVITTETEAPDVTDETEAPTDIEDTEAPDDSEETQAPVGGDETKTPSSDKEETNAPDKGNDNAPATDDKADKAEGGCGSFVNFGALAIITLAAGMGCVAFKKRR